MEKTAANRLNFLTTNAFNRNQEKEKRIAGNVASHTILNRKAEGETLQPFFISGGATFLAIASLIG